MSQSKLLRPTLVAAAVAMAIGSTTSFAATLSIVTGTVGGASFTPPVFADTAAGSQGSTTAAAVYVGATVFFDYNGNGVLDPGEPSTTTAADGSFKLASTKGIADVVALIPATTQSTVTSANATSTTRNVFRASAAQVQAATVNPTLPAKVDITPLSTEVARAAQFDGVSYLDAVNNLAQRIDVAPADVLTAPTKNTDSSALPAVLKESVVDTDRFQLAAKFVDRGDTIGELRGNFDCPNVASFDATNADACSAADLAPETSIWDAQNRAQNLEGMPRYDYVFVIIMENETLGSVLGNTSSAPFINALSKAGSTFYNYYSTGAPSEPNYLALGSADDWGQTGDEALPYPSVVGVRANVANSVDAHGLTWRHYEESLLPSPAGTTANAGASSWNAATGGAFFDNPAESTIIGNDGSTYPGSIVGKKHNTVVWFPDVVAQPNFLSNARSIGGIGQDVHGNAIPYAWGSTSFGAVPNTTGDWDAALQKFGSGITSWWSGNTQPCVQDQFLQDLKNGDVANYNVIVPDQDDDMHNTGVVARADYFVNTVVAKIESSSIWSDPTKRVAIVVTYDEGESATTSCCGWNPERSGDGAAQIVTFSADGKTVVSSAAALSPFPEAFKASTTFTPPADAKGNHGHGVTVFSLYTNQQAMGAAPAGNYDTDYYSHFSFVRTVQDIFGLADPGQPGTYMNRSKYTENFVEQNATVLPEFANSSNPHFDGVRAMNHVYQFPAGVQHVIPAEPATSFVVVPVTTGPDATQTNLWAVK
jgi:hypothetical protein